MADNYEINGNCAECRKKDYCSKVCSKHKKMINGLIQSKINEIMPILPIREDYEQ